MIFARGQIINRRFDFREVELDAFHFHLAFGQAVFQIAIAQIKGVIGRRHARGIRVPVEQVEGEGRLPFQIDIHHIRPDQIIGPQHIKGIGHAGAFEIAARIHAVFDLFDLILVGKDFEVPRIGEIHLCRKQSSAGNAMVVMGSHIGHGDRQQCAAHAIANRRDFSFAAGFFNLIKGGHHALFHIRAETFFSEALIRIDPRNHKDS